MSALRLKSTSGHIPSLYIHCRHLLRHHPPLPGHQRPPSSRVPTGYPPPSQPEVFVLRQKLDSVCFLLRGLPGPPAALHSCLLLVALGGTACLWPSLLSPSPRPVLPNPALLPLPASAQPSPIQPSSNSPPTLTLHAAHHLSSGFIHVLAFSFVRLLCCTVSPTEAGRGVCASCVCTGVWHVLGPH